jgi:hypothetical protein
MPSRAQRERSDRAPRTSLPRRRAGRRNRGADARARLSSALLVDLCIAGLAIATPERMVAGGRPVEVVRMKITEAGRKAIEQTRPAGR